MGITRRFADEQNMLTENALDEKSMEMLRGLRRRTNTDEVTDQA